MNKIVKRVGAVAAVVLVFCLMTSFGARLGGKQEKSSEPDVSEYQAQMQKLEELRKKAEAAEAKKDTYIAAVNAEFDGELFAPADGAEHTAHAVLPEGMFVDYWLVNGEKTEGGADFTVFATEHTTLEAVFRPEKKLVSVNSFMRLLDEDGKPTGEPFTELSFEDRESVSVIVDTETDMLTTVDHWIVNGIAIDDAYDHYLNIYVKDITEATSFEPIFAACYLRHDAKEPQIGPLFETIPLAYEGERG